MSDGTLSVPIRDTNDLVAVLEEHGAAGMQISGDSGAGKTELSKTLLGSIAREGRSSLLYLDPSGNGARSFHRQCLHMGKSVASRTHYITCADLSTIVSINPLAVDEVAHPAVVKARIACRVSHTAHILLSSWGQEDWTGTPLLFKWLTLILKSLASMRLPMAEAMHFLYPQSPVFEKLAAAVPDYFDRMELQRLTSMSDREANEQLQSTALRLRGFFDTSVTQAMLGLVKDVIDCRQMQRERQIVIVNLESLDMLRDEDQKIIANLWLAEWFHSIFAVPQSERVPSVVCCDELPVFTPSFKLIEKNLRVIRQTLCRFIGMHQGTQSFPDGTESLLLHNMIGQTGIKAYFRHTDPVDNKFFGEVLATPQLDGTREKFRHEDVEQYTAGHQREVLVDRSFTDAYSDVFGGSDARSTAFADSWETAVDVGRSSQETETEGDASTTANSHTNNESSGNASANSHGASMDEQRISRAYSDAASNSTHNTSGSADTNSNSQTRNRSRARADGSRFGVRRGSGGSQTVTTNSGRNWQRSRNRSSGVSYKTQLTPILRWRTVLRMIEFYSFDDQIRLAARDLARAGTGEFFLYVSGFGVARIYLPMTPDPFAGAPRSLERKLKQYFTELHALPQYHSLDDVIEYRARLIPTFLQNLETLHLEAPEAPAKRPTSSVNTIDLSKTNIRI